MNQGMVLPMKFNFNSSTYAIAVTTLILYSIYILANIGLVGLLISFSIALIGFAFFKELEIVTALVVIVGLVYVYGVNSFKLSASCSLRSREGFTTDGTPGEIIDVVERMGRGKYGPGRSATAAAWNAPAPAGVLASGAEGFADMPNAQGNSEDSEEVPPAPSNSEPAPAKKVDKKPVDDIAEKVAPTAEAFQESVQSGGLFKLGQLPSEAATGPHIDVGTTLMKAMSALQPEQINSMTEDTRKLLEQQKNLMGMLQNMRPVLQDGRKLLDTFSGIFGSGSGPQPFQVGSLPKVV
jgi:hypothetical protein